MDLVTLIICIVLLIIWNIGHKSDQKKADEYAYDAYHNTDVLRQMRLYDLFSTGVGLDGKPIEEPHSHPKEIQRLVKIQLEKEGLRYYNKVTWNLDYAVFDDEGHIVSVAGKRANRQTGGYML